MDTTRKTKTIQTTYVTVTAPDGQGGTIEYGEWPDTAEGRADALHFAWTCRDHGIDAKPGRITVTHAELPMLEAVAA